MDTANYAGLLAKLPKELQRDETQNSEAIEPSADDDDDDQVNIDMIWNIAEQLTEGGNCRAEFETLLKMFVDALIVSPSLKQALNDITLYAYEIIQRLHRGYGPGKVSPATQFSNALIKVLGNIKDVEDEVMSYYLTFMQQQLMPVSFQIQSFRRNMLRLIGLGEFSDLAVWKDISYTFILNEVICKACNQCRDVDLCKDKDRATVNDV